MLIFVQINRSSELGVHFNTGTQWSVSRRIVRFRRIVCIISSELPIFTVLSGFEGSGKGAGGCTNIDECTTGKHNCDANADCTDTEGSFTCQCKAGYNGDGVTCECE